MLDQFDIKAGDYSWPIVTNGKYVVLTGDSGIGKTYLRKVLNQPAEYRVVPPREVIAPHSMEILDRELDRWHGAYIIIDESVKVHSNTEMMARIISSDNYYIFVSRYDIATVPYGMRNVFTLDGGPKHFRMRPLYNKMSYHKRMQYSVLLCEDAAAGFDIIKDHFASRYSVLSADGKDNIVGEIRDRLLNKNVLILADLCGLDGAINAVMDLVLSYPNIGLYDSPSFEYELLSHPLIDRTDLRDLSDEDIMKYASEEAYYTQMVADVLFQKYDLTYDKSINAAVTFLKTGHVNNAHFHLNKEFKPSNWLYPDIPR